MQKTYTFITGATHSELSLIVNSLTDTSNMKVSLHKGATATAGNLIKTVVGNPHVTFPSTILDPNTAYTIVVETATQVDTTFNIKATLTTRNLKYSDIVSLPNVNGKAAWEQIPYYLPDGSRNPVYRCNGELNAHVCQLSVGDMDPEASLSMWRKTGAGTLTWDSAEQAYKAVGHVQMYLKPEFSHKIDKNKVYTIKVTAKVSNYSGQRFYWGGQRLDASYNHLNGFGGTYDYSAASAVYTETQAG